MTDSIAVIFIIVAHFVNPSAAAAVATTLTAVAGWAATHLTPRGLQHLYHFGRSLFGH